MDSWREDQLHSLLTVTNEQELFATFLQTVSHVGFEQYSFGIRLPLPVSSPREIIRSNYNPEWIGCYMNNHYASIDPVVINAVRSVRPLVWDEDIFSQSPEFWEEARSYNLNVGWSQAVHGANRVSSMLSFARSHDELSHSELEDRSAYMTWITQLLHEGICKFLLPVYLPEAFIELTPKESEVLRWTAEGKTSHEIGIIMNVSHKTVNFHLGNAVTKLNASNKTSAAIKAIALRLI